MSHNRKYSARVNWNSSHNRSTAANVTKQGFQFCNCKTINEALSDKNSIQREDCKKIKSPNRLCKRLRLPYLIIYEGITDLLFSSYLRKN